jgi:hypothetical protein
VSLDSAFAVRGSVSDLPVLRCRTRHDPIVRGARALVLPHLQARAGAFMGEADAAAGRATSPPESPTAGQVTQVFTGRVERRARAPRSK